MCVNGSICLGDLLSQHPMFGVSAAISIRHALSRDVTNTNMAARMDLVYIASFDFW